MKAEAESIQHTLEFPVNLGFIAGMFVSVITIWRCPWVEPTSSW